MKKLLSIGIIAIVVVVFGGCSVSKTETVEQSDQPVATETEKKDGMMDELEKIKSGESMKCVYTIKMDGKEFQSESYVQGKKYKSISIMGADDDAKTYMIFDGEDQYSWVDGQREGFKMNIDCADKLGGEVDEAEEQDSSSSDDIMEMDDIFENAVNVDCQPVKDIDFSVPSEITFIDQCEMLKDQMKQIEELGGAVPEGFEIPADMQ